MKIFNDSTVLSVLAVLGITLVTQLQANAAVIYSDANDGFLEIRDNLPPTSPWPVVHGDTFGNFDANVGEWFGPGLTTIVLPFELPNFGAVANPFTAADLGVMVHRIGDNTVTDIDLYGVRVDANPAISTSDWYSGAGFDGSATLIQESFLTPASPSGFVGAPNNNTNAAGDGNLLSFLNSSYAAGANAGDFVFLRLSYGSDTFASGWDAYKITVREAGLEGEWPVITYDSSVPSVPEPSSLVLIGLGAVMICSSLRRKQ